MKNFRIDVIMDEERRSASPVSVKFVARVAGITVAAAVLLVASIFVGNVLRDKARASRINAKWAKVEPQWEKAKRDRADFDRNKAILDEIQGWSKSRIEWHKHLVQVAEIVPEGVQIERMNAKGGIGVHDGNAAMQYGMTLDGTARANDRNQAYLRSPHEDVLEFEKRLNTAPSFSKQMISNVEVPPQFFMEDKSAGADKRDRKFKIIVSYRPRRFLP